MGEGGVGRFVKWRFVCVIWSKQDSSCVCCYVYGLHT